MNKQQQADLSFKEKVAAFLNNHWKGVVLFFAAIVVLMAGILVADNMRRNKISDSAVVAEDIQEAYEEWMREVPESRNDEELNLLIDNAMEEYSRHFAAQRALFTRGLMALENEEWEAAYTAFEDLASRWSDSYLAPVSLFNAGAAREEAGDTEAAVSDWQTLVDEYSATAPDAPEALFNIGRVAESSGDDEAALSAYREVESRFSNSRWTDLSKSRILVIESR